MLLSKLLSATVTIAATDRVLVLNSAADAVVAQAIQQASQGSIILAEDNIAAVAPYLHSKLASAQQQPELQGNHVQHVAFHDYILHYPAATTDVALMNLLYQPGSAWIQHGLHLAAYALRPHGRLYVTGAKDRGILSTAKRMQALFGNVETLTISKGHRVICSQKLADFTPLATALPASPDSTIFAEGKLDEGTRLLIAALEVQDSDDALDIGSGAGYIGLHIARLATEGHVTMVDASLVAAAAAQRAIEQSGLQNIRVLPSDGTQAVSDQRFDLIATNPPFHHAGIQTTATAQRFIREAATLLRPSGRFYLVANRFLKYEPTIQECFRDIVEVGGNKGYKVLRATKPY